MWRRQAALALNGTAGVQASEKGPSSYTAQLPTPTGRSVQQGELQAQIDEVNAKLLAWHRADECSQRLAKIPGVGLIGAVLLTMKTPAPGMFRSSRQFAAWIGLTPRDHSTAGRVRPGVI